jgi:NADH:ubiquinone oxidoreductase subunit 2 (subunit N)
MIYLYGLWHKNYLIENQTLEYILLIIVAQICMFFVFSSIDFINLIISFECLSFISYILISYERRNKFSAKSGIQYLILSGVISALLFMSFSLLYRAFGTFNISFINILTDYKKSSIIVNYDNVSKLFNLGYIEQALDELYMQLVKNQIKPFCFYTTDEKYTFYCVYLSVILFITSLGFKGVISPFHV